MAASNEYFTFHLTPRGWVEGSAERPIPDDRVMTVTFHEYQSSVRSELDRSGHVEWRHPDEEMTKELIKKFGKVPYRYRDVPVAG
jgi:hypothetical protein